ncbi:MAG: STAS domain-containing protein [bacterium]
MRLDTRSVGGVVVIEVGGPIDATNSFPLSGKVNSLLHENKLKLILDLEDVDYINSAGLGTLAALQKRARAKGGEIILINPQPFIYKLFTTTRLDMLFKMFYDEAQALKAFDTD